MKEIKLDQLKALAGGSGSCGRDKGGGKDPGKGPDKDSHGGKKS